MNRDHQIAAALAEVRARITEAEVGAGRPPGSVRLIAVSKKMPPADILSALGAGQVDFGENYAQELRDKRTAVAAALAATGAAAGAARAPSRSNAISTSPRWHYLGPIQSNKVKYLAGQVALIHSVDDAAVLGEIDKRAGAAGVSQACLVQVNVIGEARKGGVPPDRLPALLDCFATATHVVCAGLMLIPPLTDDVSATRRAFAALRALAVREAAIVRPNVALSELSMGMSQDFVEAVAEGATMVRVGTAVFGERPSR